MSIFVNRKTSSGAWIHERYFWHFVMHILTQGGLLLGTAYCHTAFPSSKPRPPTCLDRLLYNLCKYPAVSSVCIMKRQKIPFLYSYLAAWFFIYKDWNKTKYRERRDTLLPWYCAMLEPQAGKENRLQSITIWIKQLLSWKQLWFFFTCIILPKQRG